MGKKTVAVCIIAVLFIITGCSFANLKISDINDTSEDITEGKRMLFGATYMTMNNPYFQEMNAKIQEIVEANGDILIYRDPSQDQDKQNEQIKDMIDEGIDGLFLNPVNYETAEPALKACKEAGIPVFVVDTDILDEDYAVFTILSDNYNGGVQCATHLMKHKRTANIIILNSEGTKSVNQRVQGFLDTIGDDPDYKIIDSENGRGELEVCMEVVNKMINEGVEFDTVLGGNDPSALGALAALQKNQKEKGVTIYGIDGSPDTKVMIREGYIEGTSAQQPLVMAEMAVDMAYDYFDGKEVEKKVIVPVTLITADNLSEYEISGWQ